MNRKKIILRIALFLVAIPILCAGLLFLHFQYRYVQLPNGLSLQATEWLDKNIVLKNEKNEVVVQPQIMEFVWNDQYIKGRRLTPQKKSIYFIYKIGSPTAIENDENNKEIYNQLVKESGLKDSVEIAPRHFYSIEKTYWDLIEDPHYRRDW